METTGVGMKGGPILGVSNSVFLFSFIDFSGKDLPYSHILLTILTVLTVAAAAAIRHANGYTNSTLCMTASRWLLSIDENH